MKIEITETQKMFLLKAIEHKDWVLPLDKNTVTEIEFKHTYGYTKKQVNKEIARLRQQLK